MKTAEPSLSVRAPLRASLVGGGTDIPSFFETNQGAVVALAINRYVRVRLRQGHTAPPSAMVRAALEMIDPGEPLSVEVECDVPWGTGLGSSSSLAVALIHALHLWRGEHKTKRELFEEAVELELHRLKSPIGWQDQAMAAFGGAQLLQFASEPVGLTSSSVNVAPSILSHMCLIRVGGTRRADHITARIASDPNVRILNALKALVPSMVSALEMGNLEEVGRLLNKGWMLKRDMTSGVTNPEVDALHAVLCDAGALGAKLLGAGAAGYMLAIVPNVAVWSHPVFQTAVKIDIDPFGSQHSTG